MKSSSELVSHTELDLGDHHIEYRWIAADRVAPVLVFLHEGLGCVDLWKGFPEQLAAAVGLPAFVYSRRGYGRSSPIDLPRPVSFMHKEALDELPKILAAMGIDDAILIGHSDGASIAIIHAGGLRSQTIRGLILEAPHVFVENDTITAIKAAKQAYLETDLRDRLRKYHGENVDCAFWGWNGVWLDDAFRAWNIEAYLPKISVPKLVIQGADDPYGTVAQVEAIEQQSGGSVATLVLSGCGHSPHSEPSDVVGAAMADFIEKTLLSRC